MFINASAIFLREKQKSDVISNSTIGCKKHYKVGKLKLYSIPKDQSE